MRISFGPEGMKAAATNAPMFAHATEALMSRLPTVDSQTSLPEHDAKPLDSQLIPWSRDAVCVRLADIGFEAQWIAPTEFAERLAADIELWATLTTEAGIERQ
jgi:hypothetical protein